MQICFTERDESNDKENPSQSQQKNLSIAHDMLDNVCILLTEKVWNLAIKHQLVGGYKVFGTN